MRFAFVLALALVAAAALAAHSLTSGAASTANPYDVNNSGAVTIADAIYCLNYEGTIGSGLPCDLNGDGAVSIADVLAIVARMSPATATATRTNTPAASSTATPTSTNTPVPPSTSTPTRTNTPVPPSTATPTGTNTPSPSSTPTATTSTCSVSAAAIALDTEESAFLTLINGYRAANGAPALAISYTLTKSSAWKSHDLGANSYFAHDDLNRTWIQRIAACGYTASGYIGENIAAGYVSAQAVFDAWRNSPGHNANMVNATYRAIGIGREYVGGSPYGWYWTTDFGGVADGTGGLQ